MLEFLQSYGLWILLGGGFLFLMTRGGGCGMGTSQNKHSDQGQDREADYRSSAGQSRISEATSQPIPDDAHREDVKTPVGAHSGGCH